ncbi:iron chelate uptake ABC transporter family permease subunit [Pasteurella sp. PK-2025]|uniref:iron chelate uptake ABC transporter family permease subunit n=1 Tax=unclassified Pasteurella TaxID=2621516 RepID=UPI003C7920D2
MGTKPLLALLSLLFLLSSLTFMLFNVQDWAFALRFRGEKWLLLITIAYTIGISTLLFQTLTNNLILTPSILGFDALYLLLQTLLVFLLGSVGFSQLNSSLKFVFESGFMLAASLLLFRRLNHQQDLTRMILIGVIFGVLFRSLNNLLQRLIDPTDFAVAQGASFAQFNTVKSELLGIGVVIALLSAIWIWQQRHQLDLLLLGKNHAISLGLDYSHFSKQLLICCALLVSISTALVGPILFLGLLVCAITHLVSPTIQHRVRLPITFLIGAITLISGQVIFEHLLALHGVLSVVIEFVGGIVFIALLLTQRKGY